ncbi:hypothetical protein AB0953_31115 [Streptomyces sp. NPDC046866]|uniref:hypothetical protein n=1 Tax=Streptomyces sp. NPDC046866 TaxID=3154921 RepID=UPI003455F630
MAVPEIIPIAHEPGYRTSTIGRFSGGQFLASVTYAFPDGFVMGDGWEEQKRLFVVLHKFDHDGHHQESDIWRAGTWAEQMKRPHHEHSVVARADAGWPPSSPASQSVSTATSRSSRSSSPF